MGAIVDQFEQLTDQGIKVIPLWSNSKIPMFKGWNKNWDKQQVRRTLRVYPEANIGILLGDVIDVEGDTEHANFLINEAIGTYPHPSYKSTKSVHHLFLTHDPKFRLFKKNSVEFRGHGHQSVLPPSQHCGISYQWLDKIFPIPKIPDSLLELMERLQKKPTDILKHEHARVWCSECGQKCLLNKKRLETEIKAFKFLGLKWQCQDCRQFDMRYLCRSVKSGKFY